MRQDDRITFNCILYCFYDYFCVKQTAFGSMIKLYFKSTESQIALFFLLLGINIAFFSLFAGFTAFLFFSDLSSAAALRYINAVTQAGIFGFTALGFAFIVSDKHPCAYLQIDRPVSVITCLMLIVTAIVSAPALSWIIEWNESMKLPEFLSSAEAWMRRQEDATQVAMSRILSGTEISVLLINLLVIGLLASVWEEFLFRGVLVTWLKKRFRNIHLAVFVSAFIFSAIHLQFYGFIPRLLLGLYLGYLFIWTGSVWTSIIAHFINNSVAVTAAFCYNRHWIDTSYDNFGNAGNNYLLIGLSVVLTSTCIYFLSGKTVKSN
jgi:membrane protease YdiL (CAAX protease family)